MSAHHHALGASDPGTVVLAIGGDVGALVLYVPESARGAEIEISRAGEERRTHAAVRERRLDDGSVWCVVYDQLRAGDYTIWRDTHTPAQTVRVSGAEITEVDWSGSA